MDTSQTKHRKLTVAIGCDPNAAAYKDVIISQLKGLGYTVKDFGSEDPIYARVAFAVGEAVAAHEYDRGILLCGTGIGMSIAANKVPEYMQLFAQTPIQPNGLSKVITLIY